MPWFSATDSTFERCRFESLRIASACFGAGQEQSLYRDCVFDHSTIRADAPGNARFERCSFRDVKLRSWLCFDTEFVDCVFTGRLQRCVFNGHTLDDNPDRDTNDFRGNDFSGAELVDVGFRTGIPLAKQALPVGGDYLVITSPGPSTRCARQTVMSWPDDQRRRRALALIMGCEEDYANGQDQIFLTAVRHMWPDIVHEVFDILRRCEADAILAQPG